MSIVEDDDDWWKKGKKPKDWSYEDDTYDQVDDEEPEYRECPHCRADVYEDAVRCPFCGEYISRSSNQFAKSWWVYAIVGLLLFTMLLLSLRW